MKLLVISSLYPPHYVGGYELGCRDVVEGLKARGHAVQVLTSTYGVPAPVDDGEVSRWLRHDRGFQFDTLIGDRLKTFQMEVHNRRAFRRMVAQTRPDLVYVWSPRNISFSLPMLARHVGLPVCFFVSDTWIARWEHGDRWNALPPNPAKRALKQALGVVADLVAGPVGPPIFDLRHVQFCSDFLKRHALELGQPVGDARVIHWGVDPAQFAPGSPAERPRRLLFVGQIAQVKGTHTAIEAFARIAPRFPDLTLTVAGGSIFPGYEAQVRQQAHDSGVGNRIHFTGMLPREQLPDLYRAHDTLIFPSTWHEPFSITLLEGLASGLAVVGTTTGGSAEILRDGDNALTFPADDAATCATQLARLCDDPALFRRLAVAGRASVEHDFTMRRMLDQIETDLRTITGTP